MEWTKALADMSEIQRPDNDERGRGTLRRKQQIQDVSSWRFPRQYQGQVLAGMSSKVTIAAFGTIWHCQGLPSPTSLGMFAPS